MYKRVMVFPDSHLPYQHPCFYKFSQAIIDKYKPDLFVHSGDLLDNHPISFHSHNVQLPGADQDIKICRRLIKKFGEMVPKMTIVMGNHDLLLQRKALEHGIPEASLRSIKEIFECPKGWQFVMDYKFNTPLGQVYLCHGKSSGPATLSRLYAMNTIQGHFHEACSVVYTSSPEKLFYDLHVGCMVDDKSRAMDYNKPNPKRPVYAITILLNGIPFIIPMIVKNGRWTGLLP